MIGAGVSLDDVAQPKAHLVSCINERNRHYLSYTIGLFPG